MFKAAAAGKLGKVQTVLDKGAPIEWAEPAWQGRKAIHVASAGGQGLLADYKAIVLLLISRGADVNARADEDGKVTPLHGAAYAGEASICTALLAVGADPTATNNKGETALDIARTEDERMPGYCTECVAILEAVSKAWATGERDMAGVLKAYADKGEAAWEASAAPEALAAVTVAVESGDTEKAAAAQQVLEQTVAAAGIQVCVVVSVLHVHSAMKFRYVSGDCSISID
eukprot:COSAG06_NODE_6370_length_2963_cov_2.951117_3_plen_230_part_00